MEAVVVEGGDDALFKSHAISHEQVRNEKGYMTTYDKDININACNIACDTILSTISEQYHLIKNPKMNKVQVILHE